MTAKINWLKYLQERGEQSLSANGSSRNGGEGHVSTENDNAGHFSVSESVKLRKIIHKSLRTSTQDVEIQRQDPSSPLCAISKFEALHLPPNLLKGVYLMEFNAPSKIQEAALPILLAHPPQNLIAQSQSGTGKTAAFVLAMLYRVDTNKHYPQVLILVPTYELAVQIGEVATQMARYCPEIELIFAIRGEMVFAGTKLTEHVVIGTPGKVLDWSLKYQAFDISKITVFVLDEADVMIATQGHQDQCIRIHKKLNKKCQMMFFSATYEEEVMEFAQIIVPNPLIIRLKREEETLDNIRQYYVRCANDNEKYDVLTNIYGTIGIGQAIIFCQTRVSAHWLARKMSYDGHAVAVLSGDLTVDARLMVLDRFRAGKEKVLITTNVLSRGIDVQQVTVVVNYDLPVDCLKRADCETYLHRIGRTGRFGKHGIAINLVDSPEGMEICKTIERHFNRQIKFLNADDSDEIEKIEG